MDFWNVVWLVAILGLVVVFPAISLIIDTRGLGTNALSEEQRRAREKELREAGILREGEAWEPRDLDALMLNMRRYGIRRTMGVAITVLLTGGVGMFVLIVSVGGSIFSFGYIFPSLGIVAGSFALGECAGYIMSDRRFANYGGTLLAPSAEAIFTGAGGIARRSWWLQILDVGLLVGVSVCTLLYALGKGGTLDNPTTRLAITHHPWLIWCIPVALCIVLATKELLAWWEMRRPPLRLTEQPELAGRADMHRRREACKGLNDSTPVGLLSFLQLIAISSQALFSIEFPLLIVALGALIVGAFARMKAESRTTRQGQRTGDAGIHGGGGAV
ncbi:MAG: hypothetical protein ACXWPI_14135 [Ktedonobacterales bacterium]